MKKIILFFVAFATQICFAQNIFPTSGNVGIGTTTPDSKLDVLGQIKSYNAGFGQTDQATSTKNYANFSANNHGSVLVSSNLYFSTNDVLKIANTHGTINVWKCNLISRKFSAKSR